MRHTDVDLDAIEAMLDDLPALLEGEQLFREVVVERADPHAGADKVTLTLGALLDAMDTAAYHGTQETRLAAARSRLAAMREALPEPYAQTVRRELRSALNDWRALADDLEDDVEDVADAWAYAIQNRSRAERLLAEAAGHGLEDDGAGVAIAGLDRRIRPLVAAAAFQGPPAEHERYPREGWWWLWSAPKD
jgi:hypothetical protein